MMWAVDGFDPGIPGLSEYSEIGAGGFAIVFSAFEADAGRTVAVKVLGSVDERGRRRFERERRTMGRTTAHDNIVTMFRSGYTEPGSRPYLVMEHMSGGSLQDRLDRSGPIPIEEAAGIIAPIGRALEYAHASGILHRDIKPANILISATGTPKLGDFGIAAVRDATGTSQVAFSLAYTAPETFDTTRDHDGELNDPRDERSDLYSLAVTMYALVTGRPPFAASSQAALIHQILVEPPPPIGEPRLDAFFATALAKEPSNRHPTVASFLQALADATRPQPSPPPAPATPPAPPTPPVTHVVTGGLAAGGPSAPAATLSGPRTWLLSLSLTAVMAVIAGIVFATTRGDDVGSRTDSGAPVGDTSAGGGSTLAPSVSTGSGRSIADPALSGSSIADPAKLPTDMAGWEALWADQRQATVDRIKANNWGVSADGRTLTGPEGFTIDLSACPSGWSPTEGITDGEIKIGQTLAQSGTLAYAANYGKGQEAVLDYYGARGAFTDINGKARTVTYLQRDDGYDPVKTVPLVDELLDTEKVFAQVTLGSPNTMQVYDKLNDRCVPQLFNQSGHPAWGDPQFHPWTTGLGLAYTTETWLWGLFLEQHIDEFPGGVTVAALVESDQWGNMYDAGFRNWLEASPIKDKVTYVTESVDLTAATITDQMAALGATKPQVFVAMVAGGLCSDAVVEAAQNGMKTTVAYLWQPSTCAGSTQLARGKVGGDGSAAEGWWIVNGGSKDVRDPNQLSDPTVVWAREVLTAHGDDPDAAVELGLGVLYGWAWAQVIQIAGQLDGGLTRANTILAARSLDMNNPLQLPGVVFHVDGNRDAYYSEAGVFQQFDVAQQSYISKSQVFSVDGASKNCHFEQATASCAFY